MALACEELRPYVGGGFEQRSLGHIGEDYWWPTVGVGAFDVWDVGGRVLLEVDVDGHEEKQSYSEERF